MHIEIDEGIRSLLILEDEMLVAMMMEDLARSLGVKDVHICTDSAEALKLLATAHVDCAVLDLWVRDGTSMAVADLLTEKKVPFLFSSGSDSGALEPRHAGRPMISKPFLDDDFKLVLLDTWTMGRSGQVPLEAQAAARVATSGATD